MDAKAELRQPASQLCCYGQSRLQRCPSIRSPMAAAPRGAQLYHRAIRPLLLLPKEATPPKAGPYRLALRSHWPLAHLSKGKGLRFPSSALPSLWKAAATSEPKVGPLRLRGQHVKPLRVQ